MIRKIEFRAMGCGMSAALDNPSAHADELLADIPKRFEEWEQTLSRFREDSELSKLNREAGTPTQVSQTFADVFETARGMERFSEGLVTPVILNALEAAGYDRSFDSFANQSAFPASAMPVCLPQLSEVQWDARNRIICAPHDVQLDFGGVAKGWAAQKACQRLAAHGPVLVNAGGDIAISAPRRDGQAWDIGVVNPFDPEQDVVVLMVPQGGVATSGKDYRRWQMNGVWKHHIIDPRLGLPTETDVLTATVIAPNAIEAEAAAKTLHILGSRAGMDWLEAQPDMAGILILDDGQRLFSRRMEKYLSLEIT